MCIRDRSTKGNKKTTFRIPNELTDLLQEWKKQQKIELAKFNIIQTPDQYVFTYIDTKGNVNSCLHADYLNNKMKSVKRRHPELAHATPHKLRHNRLEPLWKLFLKHSLIVIRLQLRLMSTLQM